MAESPNPSALVSWAQREHGWTEREADAWRDQIAAFVDALRSFGIDAQVDLHHLSRRGTDWTRFGPTAVVENDWVIVALSPAWRDRWNGTNAPAVGAGAVGEADALRSVFAEHQGTFRDKVVLVTLPLMFDEKRLVPTGLHGVQRRTISSFDLRGVADLLRLLTGQDAFPAGPLGAIPELLAEVPRSASRFAKHDRILPVIDDAMPGKSISLGDVRDALSTPPADEALVKMVLDRAMNYRLYVRIMHENLNLSDDVIARVAGVQPKTVRRWRSEDPDVAEPRAAQAEAIERLRAIALVLVNSGTFLDLAGIGVWFRGLRAELGWKAPCDVLAAGSETAFRKVLREAQRFVNPAEGSGL